MTLLGMRFLDVQRRLRVEIHTGGTRSRSSLSKGIQSNQLNLLGRATRGKTAFESPTCQLLTQDLLEWRKCQTCWKSSQRQRGRMVRRPSHRVSSKSESPPSVHEHLWLTSRVRRLYEIVLFCCRLVPEDQGTTEQAALHLGFQDLILISSATLIRLHRKYW